MISFVYRDLYRKAVSYNRSPTPAAVLSMLVCDGTAAQVIYRAMQFCQNHRLQILAMILQRLNFHIAHCVIGRGAELGPGLVISHSLGVVINSQVRAGCNLNLEHCVTLGAIRGQSPVLGDDVFIGAGAKVLGPVRVGSNVKIGANAVVVHDIPDNCTAVGIPARVIKVNNERVADIGVDTVLAAYTD